MNRAPIVVALSGGVDSAVAAGLLVEAGERVVGITMRLYDARGTEASAGGRCCGPRDIEDARRVCNQLDIPFYVADDSDEFRARVVDDFVSSYVAGRTPNPCVRCNQHVKFTPLARRARALGATALATGHYARIEGPEGGRSLLRARDRDKDQSYFLFAMPRASLDFVRFPVGDMTKEEVRAHARRLGLPNAAKEESQEICFIPDGDHAKFVAARAPTAAGEIVSTDGRVLGRHEGVHRFTVGQRRGLGALDTPANGERPKPRYVVALDARAGRVIVGDEPDLLTGTFAVEEVMWWSEPVSSGLTAQIRHRHPAAPALVERAGEGRARVTFASPQRAVAPGQAAVFYDGDRVIGGGFIADAARS